MRSSGISNSIERGVRAMEKLREEEVKRRGELEMGLFRINHYAGLVESILTEGWLVDLPQCRRTSDTLLLLLTDIQEEAKRLHYVVFPGAAVRA